MYVCIAILGTGLHNAKCFTKGHCKEVDGNSCFVIENVLGNVDEPLTDECRKISQENICTESS